MYVFLPPTDLKITMKLLPIEITAEKLQMPVRIEGREMMMVTPDPGVIEVNVHPAVKTWQVK
jgi:uncharacterized protein (DUF2126 family)